MENQVESELVQKELGDGITECKRWIQEIEQGKKDFKEYWKNCDDVVARYKDEHENHTNQHRIDAQRLRKYNVLWSMTETMKPLVYSDAPRPYIHRRHSDRDPVGRDASLIIERGLKYDLEGDELHDALMAARDDFILCARGVIWPRYKPHMVLRKSEHRTYLQPRERAPKDVEIQKDEYGRFYQDEFYAKVDEEIDWEYVHYRNFLHGKAAKWKHVPWVARRVDMTRSQLIERFGEEIGKKVPLTVNNKQTEGEATRSDEASDDHGGLFAKAEVWEIWVKDGRKVLWVCPEWSKSVLDRQDDFLNLREFFPCPKPAYSLITNDTLVPKPEYLVWQGIAVELDDITNRLKMLVQALRVAGVYDKSAGDQLKRVTSQTAENEMIPVDNWAMFAERGGLKGIIEFLPIEQVAGVVQQLYAARSQLLQELYDITGISDIVRGASDPRETARAQQIKGNYAGKRLGSKQKEFLRMVDQALEIQTQIMCEHYSDDTLAKIASADQILVDPATQQFNPQRFQAALQIIREAPLRRYRVKVDERSLAMNDVLEDRQQRQEYLMGIAQLLQSATMMAKENPAAAPLMGELLLFGVRGFPDARSTEAAIEGAIQAMQQAGPPPKEEQGSKGKPPEELQAEMQMFQAKMQIEQQRLEMEKQRLIKDYELKEREQNKREAQAQYEFDLRDRRDKGELTVAASRLDLDRRIHQDKLALEAGKLEVNATYDMEKLSAESALRNKDIESRRETQTAQALIKAEKDAGDLELKRMQSLLDAFNDERDREESRESKAESSED